MKTCFICNRDVTDEKTWFSEPIDGYLCGGCKELPVVDRLEELSRRLFELDPTLAEAFEKLDAARKGGGGA